MGSKNATASQWAKNWLNIWYACLVILFKVMYYSNASSESSAVEVEEPKWFISLPDTPGRNWWMNSERSGMRETALNANLSWRQIVGEMAPCFPGTDTPRPKNGRKGRIPPKMARWRLVIEVSLPTSLGVRRTVWTARATHDNDCSSCKNMDRTSFE